MEDTLVMAGMASDAEQRIAAAFSTLQRSRAAALFGDVSALLFLGFSSDTCARVTRRSDVTKSSAG
jgi:hypothetical protein